MLKIFFFAFFVSCIIILVIWSLAHLSDFSRSNLPSPSFDRYIVLEKTTIPHRSYKYQALYFYADWCSSCMGENNDYYYHADKISEMVQVVRVNFDQATDLKSRYHIVYQGTIVLIDGDGREITRWIGGGVEKLNQVVYSVLQNNKPLSS